ncbi:MAG: hypothetical protein VCA55_09175 [Verrucomicrobiales bacterium]
MIRKLLHTILPTSALAIFAATAFSGCEATQVGNWDGSGLDSGLSNLPQARHEAWETDARFGNLPQSR